MDRTFCHGNRSVNSMANAKSELMAQEKTKTEAKVTNCADRRWTAEKVREDGILKEIFQKEDEARLVWEKKWGFLRNTKKLRLDEANRRGICISSFRKSRTEEQVQGIQLKDSGKIPETSSGMIGWRSAVLENDYNRLVGLLHVSAKSSKCPPRSKDEPDPSKQRCIFLG